jgi:hypothetical protein
MTVGNRLRFEVLRRDRYTCRYCGAKAPDVELTVDHVTPIALGGRDEPSNLITACRTCNSGKSSTSGDDEVVEEAGLKALAWKEAMRQVAEERVEQYADQSLVYRQFEELWNTWTYRGKLIPLPSTWSVTIQKFLDAGLTMVDFDALISVAMHAPVPPRDTFRYFCGCCWHRIREAQDRAAEILADWEAADAE